MDSTSHSISGGMWNVLNVVRLVDPKAMHVCRL
jgi:hypothetical protein